MGTLELELSNDLLNVGYPENESIELWIGGNLAGTLDPEDFPDGWPVPAPGQRLTLRMEVLSMEFAAHGDEA